MRYITLIFLFALSQVFGQDSYELDTINQEQRKQYVQVYQKSNKKLIKQLKTNYSKKTAKKLSKNLTEFSVEFENKIIDGNFIFDKRFLVTATDILKEFKAKNQNIPKDIHVLISKDPSLNAYCLPDGTFVLNMGLFYWLENENQLAGVMAHELSHKLLNHSINAQVNQVENESSGKAKQRIKKIKRNRYNKVSRAFDLYKNQLYAWSKDRRKKEIEADSLGYVLLKKTKYNESEFVETLKLMKMYDTIRPTDLKKSIYAKVFDLPNQKFNADWLKCEDFSGYRYNLYKEEFNKDSIASHPETIARIKKLQVLQPLNINKTKAQPSMSFLKLKEIAEYNLIPNLMYFEQNGLSIYLCLKQIQGGNKESYYKKLLGENFKKILEGRNKYQLNRYLERVNPEKQSKSYIQFLNFMWNLNLTEIENITKYYAVTED